MTVRSERSNIHDCMVEVAKKNFPYQLRNNLFLICLGKYRLEAQNAVRCPAMFGTIGPLQLSLLIVGAGLSGWLTWMMAARRQGRRG